MLLNAVRAVLQVADGEKGVAAQPEQQQQQHENAEANFEFEGHSGVAAYSGHQPGLPTGVIAGGSSSLPPSGIKKPAQTGQVPMKYPQS